MNINDPIPNKMSCSKLGYRLYNDAPDERDEDLVSESSELNDY